jgi:capsular polysaccharide biosynthesis protein
MILDRNALAERPNTIVFSRAETFLVPELPGLPSELQDKVGEYTTPQPFIAQFEKAELRGPAGVGYTADGDIILETAFAGRFDALDRNRPHLAWAEQAIEQEALRVELGVSMLGVWSGFYFHWMLEQLTKLQGIDKWVGKENTWPKLIVQKDPPRFVTETINMLGYQYVESNGRVQVDKLLVPSHRRHQGRTAPGAIAWLRENISTKPCMEVAKRVMIDRRGASERRVLNWHALEMSFPLYDPVINEDYLVAEQADIFGRATHILAPHGGGLTNMIFGRERKHIIELFGSYINPCYFTLAAACGHAYTPMTCEATGSDLSVDLPELAKILDETEKAAT